MRKFVDQHVALTKKIARVLEPFVPSAFEERSRMRRVEPFDGNPVLAHRKVATEQILDPFDMIAIGVRDDRRIEPADARILQVIDQ